MKRYEFALDYRVQPPVGRALLVVCCLLVVGGGLAGQQQGDTWNIVTDPEVRIGEESGSDVYLFQSITAARFLPDGRIVVADAGFHEIRIFRNDGTFQTRFGRSGGGPGEFSSIMGMWLTRNGSIAVWDSENRRVTLINLHAALETTHSVRAPPVGGNLEVFYGSFANDDIVLGSLFHGRRGPGLPPLVADRVELARFTLSGEYKGQLGRADGLWRFNGYPVPFSSVPASVVVRDSIYVVDGYQAEITVRDSRGVPIRTIALPHVKTVTAGDPWSFLETQLRENKNTLFLQYLQRNRVPRDDEFPQIGGLLSDDEDHIWVKEYDPYKDSIWFKHNAILPAEGGQWRVIRPDGTRLAVVRIPDAVRPLEINGDRLLGVERDQLGVQRIVVHAIQR